MARAKTREKLPTRKISETFLDFAEPLLTPLGAEAAEHEMEEALQIAFTVWNAVVFDAVDCSSRWVDQLRDLAGHDPDIRPLIEQLVRANRPCLATTTAWSESTNSTATTENCVSALRPDSQIRADERRQATAAAKRTRSLPALSRPSSTPHPDALGPNA